MSKRSCFILILGFLFSYQGLSLEIDTTVFQIQVDNLWQLNYSTTSLDFAEQLNEQAKQAAYRKGEAEVKLWMGDYHTNSGRYDIALKDMQRALSLGKELQNQAIEARANMALGSLYLGMREFDKSIPYTSEAIRIFRQLDYQESIVGCYNHLGIAFLNMGQLERGLDTLLKVQPYVAENYSGEKLYSYNVNLGIAYAQLGNFEAAIPSFEKQLAFKKEQKDTSYFAPSYGNLAYAFQNIGEFDKAFTLYDSSLYYSNLLNQGETTYITLLDMVDGYKLKGDYSNALSTYQKYHDTYLKVLDERTKAKMADSEVKYDTEQKEKAIVASQSAINDLEQSAKIRRQQLFLLLGGLLSILVITLSLYYKWQADLSRKEVQEKLIQSELKNKELETKNLENQLHNQKIDLTNLALDISRKNEFSAQLIEQLEAIKGIDVTQKDKTLEDIIKFVNSQTQGSKEITFLQKNIAQINQSFYKNLENQFSNLTANDKYLSGLIRLNLSNKDIANIKGISLSSAKMGRYRLRKKLELDPDTDIVGFLQQF